MDWAALGKTIEHLETLSEDEIIAEMQRLQADDDELAEAAEAYLGNREKMLSFMQTRMPEDFTAKKATLKSGARVGSWKIDQLIGSGGMGEVYKAERADGMFDQQVALKLAKRKGKAFAARFEAERQRLAQLDHPNIARIVDGGAAGNGAPFMTMEFVDGQPITEYTVFNSLDRNARLALVRQLCTAVSHAHSRLVLHRDIKHDNVLINQDGQLRLIDFGVASLVGEEEGAAKQGPLTLAYAAPEQLKGDAVSAATDIFAVGMLMHLLETGALPARQPDASVAIADDQLADRDLAAIIAKAIATDPDERYGSVDALEDDIAKYLGGFPVAARSASAVARFTKLVRRNKLTSIMSGTAAAALVAGVIGASVFAYQANEARAEAEERLEWAEYSLEEARLETVRVGAQQDLFQKFVIDEARIAESDLRSFLVNSAEDAKQSYDRNPELSSALISAVANYLLRRGDYNGSKNLNNFVISHKKTPEITVQDAKIMQGRNLRELGDEAGSEKMLGEVIDWMQTKPFTLKSEGYALIVTNYAMATLDEEDLKEAVRVNLIHANDTDKDASGRAYHYNSLGVLSGKLGNYQKMIEYGIQSVQFSREAENINFVSLNTRSLNLVGSILFAQQDIELARSFFPSEVEVMDEEKGHLRHRSLYRLHEGLMLQIEKNHEASFEKAKQAFAIAADQYPPGSSYYYSVAGFLIEAGALAGKPDDVRELLDSVLIPVDDTSDKPHARGELAQAFLLNAEGQREKALAIYKSLDSEKINRDYELIYKRDLLRKTLNLR